MKQQGNEAKDDGDIGIVIVGEKAVENEREKLAMIIDLHEEDELKEDYQNIYNTAALVAALFMSFLVSLEGFSVDTHPDNLWGDHEEVGIDLFHLSVGVTLLICLFVVLLCVVLLFQMSHAPKNGMDELFEEFGMGLMQGPPTGVAFMLYSFGITLILLFSLSMRHWVAAVNILMSIAGLCYAPYLTHVIINKKMRVLRKLKRRKELGKSNERS